MHERVGLGCAVDPVREAASVGNDGIRSGDSLWSARGAATDAS